MLKKFYKIATNHPDYRDFDLSQPETWNSVTQILNEYIVRKEYGAQKTGTEVRKRLVAIRTIMRKKDVMTSFLSLVAQMTCTVFYKFNLKLIWFVLFYQLNIPADWASLKVAKKLFETKFSIPKLAGTSVPALPRTSMTMSTNFASISHFPAVDPSMMGQWVDDMALLSEVDKICKDLKLGGEEEHIICTRAGKRDLMHLIVDTQDKRVVVAKLLVNLKRRGIFFVGIISIKIYPYDLRTKLCWFILSFIDRIRKIFIHLYDWRNIKLCWLFLKCFD